MGGGSWSSSAYEEAREVRKAKGRSAFHYNEQVRKGRISKVHGDLDPARVAGPASPLAGRPVRESRDSEEHPNSLPIAVIFDVTGSMGHIPKTLQKKLPSLMDVIVDKGGIADPQILVGAVGDAKCDRYPFQVGQFESDNRFDEQLRNIILEGGGGGQIKESYGLAYKFGADHTATDSFERRGKKGYLFTMGDEAPWETITRGEVQQLFGVGAEKDERIEDVLARCKEKWEVFHLCSMDGSYPNNQQIHGLWTELLGDRYLKVADSSMICEVVAAVVYLLESAAPIPAVVQNMGLRGKAAATVANALAPLAASLESKAAGALPPSHGA